MASKVADQSQEFEEFRRTVATEREGESAALQAVVEERAEQSQRLSEQNGTIADLKGVVSRLEGDITAKNRKLDEESARESAQAEAASRQAERMRQLAEEAQGREDRLRDALATIASLESELNGIRWV